jgi:hypothetical protein
MVSTIEKLRVVHNNILCNFVNNQMLEAGQGATGICLAAFSAIPDVPNRLRSSLYTSSGGIF